MSKKSPQLRFEDFTDDWEQRKLKDIFDVHTDFVSNGSFQALKENVQLYKTENYAYMIRLQDASNNWDGPWLYTDKQGFDFLDKSTVYKDDILMSDRGTIGKFFLVPQLDKPMTLSSNAVLLRSTKNDNNFIYYMLNTSNISNQIIVRTTPGVQPMISKTEFKKINTCIPNIEEQQKIGSFFQQLDETIALHQRKLDLLKEQKKGYLQKMFPKNGAKVPELRFAGFADDWEERKFGELYKKVNEKNDLSFGKDRVISVANMYFKDTGNIRSDDAYMKTYNIFRTGDIAFEGNRSKHFSYGRFVENTIGDGIVSHVFDVFRPIQQFDLNYWKYAIHNERVMGPILMTATTSSTMMTNLVAKDFLKRAILVPSYSEQKLVGSFFKQLDDTIALHQRKLDLLKEQKKGFLQNMFV